MNISGMISILWLNIPNLLRSLKNPGNQIDHYCLKNTIDLQYYLLIHSRWIKSMKQKLENISLNFWQANSLPTKSMERVQDNSNQRY
jgi:hypothetical protein